VTWTEKRDLLSC